MANYIHMYYGTGDESLGRTIEIDPEFKQTKKFEFGGGFYLSVSKDMAASYAELGVANSFLDKPINEEMEDYIVNGFTAKCYVHELIIDYNELLKEKNLIFETKNEYKHVITETLKGYHNNINYRPNRVFTYGLMCGSYWDKEIGKIEWPYDEFINNCINYMSKVKQLCIHKRMENGKVEGFKYFPYIKDNNIITFDYGDYMYKEELYE